MRLAIDRETGRQRGFGHVDFISTSACSELSLYIPLRFMALLLECSPMSVYHLNPYPTHGMINASHYTILLFYFSSMILPPLRYLLHLPSKSFHPSSLPPFVPSLSLLFPYFHMIIPSFRLSSLSYLLQQFINFSPSILPSYFLSSPLPYQMQRQQPEL